MRAIFAALVLLGATAAQATTSPSERDRLQVERLLSGKVAGAPVASISRQEAARMSVHDGFVLFRASRNLVYKNDLGGCGQLDNDDYITLKLYGTARLSRGDIAQVFSRPNAFFKGACAFGDFVPYRTPARS